MDEPVIPQSSSLTDGDAKVDPPSDHRPFKKPRHSMRPLISRRQSFDCSMHLLAEQSPAVLPSSEPCTDQADDATVSTLLPELIGTLNAMTWGTFEAMLNNPSEATLNNAFKATLSDAFKAKTAAHKAAMDQRIVVWKSAVDRANRRCHEAEEKLEKEREQNSVIVSSNERCHDQLANAQLTAEQSVMDAHDIGSSKDGRLAELDIDRLATMNCEWEAKLIINNITILNTEVNYSSREQMLKLRDQLREISSLASDISASVRAGFAPHGTTPFTRASTTSNTGSIHPEQPSTSATPNEHTFGFDGMC